MPSMIKAARTNPLFWGIATLVIITAIGCAVAGVYIRPPNQQIVTFYTDDAASVHPGDTVRVAGISVGKVKDLAIGPDRVRVRASVDRDVFVGDQSQVEVRMLTVVGGYYVTIIPLGDTALGSRPIPLERVTMPYSLIRTLTAATKITDNVAHKPINESINQLSQGLTGTNTEVVGELLKAGNSITQTLERQKGQLTEILEMSNEYIRRLNGSRQLLEDLIGRVAILEETLILYGRGFSRAIEGLGEVGRRLDAVNGFYFPHRSDFIARIRGVLGEFTAIADRNGLVVRVLRRVRERMQTTLDAQNHGTPPELFATDLCIPTEGSRC
jgi:phospholipid/cholesterol/gamma-HCH transport system substrate-binding protein